MHSERIIVGVFTIPYSSTDAIRSINTKLLPETGSSLSLHKLQMLCMTFNRIYILDLHVYFKSKREKFSGNRIFGFWKIPIKRKNTDIQKIGFYNWSGDGGGGGIQNVVITITNM